MLYEISMNRYYIYDIEYLYGTVCALLYGYTVVVVGAGGILGTVYVVAMVRSIGEGY